ncbi:hypothetical protein AYI70_g7694 [Smittium culicis]|uniref:Uncharacterized protein n=1 Tax=Smittium culicis TaxID=133412 RepID=A0A1R1XJF0_9FUNG|nr:hypothetical protein AYI70_g7694 [Smittium culicis]
MPLTDFAVYPELIKALHSIEEDFFRTPLTEEERKETIHSCPTNSSMDYHPLPMKESASSAVKKTDADLHRIQISLAQATRLIDYYVHRIIQDNPKANSEDPHILFASIMRVLLADIASKVTQGRLDNLNKGMELPGKPQSAWNRIMNRKWIRNIFEKGFQIRFTKFELPSKNSEENRKRPERFSKESAATPKETSDGDTTTDTSSKTAQEENGSRCTRSPENRSGVTIDQESDRGKERRTQTNLGPEETESPCTGVELINGVSFLNLLTDPQERLHDVTGSRRCIYAYSNPRIFQVVPPLLLEWESIPVQSASVRTITESPHIYKDSSPDSDMGENTRIPKYSQGSIQTNGTWLQNKDGKINNEAMSMDSASWNIFPPRDNRARSYYGFERLGMGNSCGIQILLRIAEFIEGVDALQRQRIIDNIIRSSAQECYRTFSISILRQYYHIGLRQEIWSENFTKAIGDIGEDFETLFRRSESFNRADRMVNIRSRIFRNIQTIWNPRCEPFCIEGELKDQQVLQYVSGSQFVRSERTELRLEEMRQPLWLPSVEPNIASCTESSEGTTNNNTDYPPVENFSMEPRSTEAINSLAITTASNNGSAGSKKRKISAVEQQDLVSHGMENQRFILNAQGLSDTAVEIIVSNQRAVKRRSRYHSIQQRFLDWHLNNNNTAEIQANNIVNCLIHIFTTKKLSTNKIRAYKSAIFNLVDDSKSMENSTWMKEFLKAIDETEINSFVNPTINISPVIKG